MKLPCGCCEGVQAVTPQSTANRSGLTALRYRVGSYASFFETMQARLSGADVRALAGLTRRDAADPTLALLDAWASVGEVLSFYQERIANEGFLRTATERRSVLELARLVGYRLRPGVAASVHLAYSMDKDAPPALIGAGARANSIPGPGEQMQTFETSEPLKARPEWNALKPRQTQPQSAASILKRSALYLKGTAANLKPHDLLLIQFAGAVSEPRPFRVHEVKPDDQADRTEVTLRTLNGAVLLWELVDNMVREVAKSLPRPQEKARKRVLASLPDMATAQTNEALIAYLSVNILPVLGEALGANAAPGPAWKWLSEVGKDFSAAAQAASAKTAGSDNPQEEFNKFLDSLQISPPKPPASTRQLPRTADATFAVNADIFPRLLTALQPALGPVLYAALRNKDVTPEPDIIVYAPRKAVPMFGHNAPLKPILDGRGVVTGHEEWPLTAAVQSTLTLLMREKTPRLATVSVRRGAVSESAETVLGADAGAGTTETVKLTLGALSTVTITVDYAADGASRINLVFSELHRSVVLVPGAGAALIRATVHGETRELAAGQRLAFDAGGDSIVIEVQRGDGETTVSVSELAPVPSSAKNVAALDAAYDKIVPQSWVLIERADLAAPVIAQVAAVRTVTRADYGLTARVTELLLTRDWLSDTDLYLTVLRGATVNVQSESLPLAEEPLDADVEGQRIELDALYDGLESGRWLIVAGERADVAGASGVRAAELAMLAGVEQATKTVEAEEGPVKTPPAPLKGDKLHTLITLAKPLAYRYKRGTVVIHGNVAPATHGETRDEVLGAGDAAQSLQRFVLKQPPLTWVAAPTVSGVESTLTVRVNGVQWHEADSLPELAPSDRRFLTQTDEDGRTTVVFGDGVHGARLPTGFDNVKARYRNGIGRPGNVKAEQISLLATKPLGVKSVLNPLRASGGADRESRDQARQNAPLAVMALDRLVSTRDHADFARVFAGVGKASAVHLSDGARDLVLVTICGADDIPIDTESDLYQNLNLALHRHGDPHLAIGVRVRELLALAVGANVKVLPDFDWESVEPAIRAALLDAFGFARSELGRDVFASAVIATIQQVPGVRYVDLDFFHAIDYAAAVSAMSAPQAVAIGAPMAGGSAPMVALGAIAGAPGRRVRVKAARVEDGVIHPAQLAYLQADVPDTLILNEITS